VVGAARLAETSILTSATDRMASVAGSRDGVVEPGSSMNHAPWSHVMLFMGSRGNHVAAFAISAFKFQDNLGSNPLFHAYRSIQLLCQRMNQL